MRSEKVVERPGRSPRNAGRRGENGDAVAATVNLQRTPAGSITVWVEAPDGSAAGIELDQLDRRNPGARALVGWAREQVGKSRSRRGARVELVPRNEGTYLRVKSRRHEGAINLDEVELDARVMRWAKAALRPPARRRRPVRAWA
jgi:hypothetical protein